MNILPRATNEYAQIQINDKNMPLQMKEKFAKVNSDFKNVFNSSFLPYNDNSGIIRANLNLGPVEPCARKGKMPFYDQKNLQMLQQEADKLEKLGVLGKHEVVGVEVKYCSPSFLREKP